MAKKKSLAAGRRALALFLAVSLVLTMASVPPGGPVGVASASHSECTQIDEILFVYTLGHLGNPFAVNQQCDPSALSDHADELEAAHENATKTDIHNTGAQTAADGEQFLAVMNNYLQDSGTPAMMEAEAAAVAAIDAGKTEAEVEAAAVQAVQDYYTKKQMNMLDQWNVAMSTVWTMENTSDVAGISESFVQAYPFSETIDSNTATYRIVGFRDTETMTLINGSAYLVHEVGVEANQPTSAAETRWFRPNTGEWRYINPQWQNVSSFYVEPVSGSTSVEAVRFAQYKTEWDAIVSKSNQMEANAELYASSLYNQTQNGTANVSDHISGATLAEQYATDFETTGYFAYAVGWAATQGMAVPKMENTSLMTIQTVSETYQGLIMSQNPPANGVWEIGVTYDASSIQGVQMVATTDGEIIELEGQFTIQSMEGPDGTEVTTTTVRHINRTVINESADYEELQQEIRSLREEIEDIEPPGGSGGGGDGGGFDFNLGSTGLVVIAAAAAAAVLLLGRN